MGITLFIFIQDRYCISCERFIQNPDIYQIRNKFNQEIYIIKKIIHIQKVHYIKVYIIIIDIMSYTLSYSEAKLYHNIYFIHNSNKISLSRLFIHKVNYIRSTIYRFTKENISLRSFLFISDIISYKILDSNFELYHEGGFIRAVQYISRGGFLFRREIYIIIPILIDFIIHRMYYITKTFYSVNVLYHYNYYIYSLYYINQEVRILKI